MAAVRLEPTGRDLKPPAIVNRRSHGILAPRIHSLNLSTNKLTLSHNLKTRPPLCLQNHAIYLYRQPVESNLHIRTVFLYNERLLIG